MRERSVERCGKAKSIPLAVFGIRLLKSGTKSDRYLDLAIVPVYFVRLETALSSIQLMLTWPEKGEIH